MNTLNSHIWSCNEYRLYSCAFCIGLPISKIYILPKFNILSCRNFYKL